MNRGIKGNDEEFARLRPDRVLRNEAEKKITIVDVAFPVENQMESFNEGRGKVDKYHSLAKNLERKAYVIAVDVFVVVALGDWDPGNERIYARMIRTLIISNSIK